MLILTSNDTMWKLDNLFTLFQQEHNERWVKYMNWIKLNLSCVETSYSHVFAERLCPCLAKVTDEQLIANDEHE